MQKNDYHTVIFFDIDGTLIGVNQLPNCDTLPSQVRAMRERGFRFGINSNRAYEDALRVIGQFDLDGPFILENGVDIRDGNQDLQLVSVPQCHPQTVLVDILSNTTFHGQQSHDVHVYDTKMLYQSGFVPQPGLHLYINEYRRFTGSVHHRLDGESSFAYAEQIADRLNEGFLEQGLTYNAVAHRHGNSVTVDIPGVDKASGLRSFKEHYPEVKVIGIGDGLNDLVLVAESDEYYAVANAAPELKEVADYTSKLPLTEGVCDILQYIEVAN